MSRVLFFIMGAILWLLVTWSLHYQSLITGFVVVLAATLIFGGKLSGNPARAFNPRRWYWAIRYLLVFVYYMVKANIDVSFRVLHPEKLINPGIVKIRTDLKTNLARTLLADSITLTPGTLTVEIKDEFLYIHWIDVRTEEPEQAARYFARRFERYLKEVFES
jgi:multicomponent Na+:H+ antiporter subunit E